MTSNLDIYRTAKLLIDRHGDDAVIEAAMRADKMLEAGDVEGQTVWKRVLAAIDELLSKERPKGATVN